MHILMPGISFLEMSGKRKCPASYILLPLAFPSGGFPMILRGTEDLRVQKTVAAIDQAFTAMLLESDYEDMSVKELCARAKINKKTFYLVKKVIFSCAY